MDQLNGTLPIDNYLAHELRDLAPHKSVFSMNQPYTVSSNLSIPKPVIATISNWLHEKVKKENYDPVKLAKTMALPDAP